MEFADYLHHDSLSGSVQTPFFFCSDPVTGKSVAWLFANRTSATGAHSVVGESAVLVLRLDQVSPVSFLLQQKVGGGWRAIEKLGGDDYEVVKNVQLNREWMVCDRVEHRGGSVVGERLLKKGLPDCVRMVLVSGEYVIVSGNTLYRSGSFIELLDSIECIKDSLEFVLWD